MRKARESKAAHPLHRTAAISRQDICHDPLKDHETGVEKHRHQPLSGALNLLQRHTAVTNVPLERVFRQCHHSNYLAGSRAQSEETTVRTGFFTVTR